MLPQLDARRAVGLGLGLCRTTATAQLAQTSTTTVAHISYSVVWRQAHVAIGAAFVCQRTYAGPVCKAALDGAAVKRVPVCVHHGITRKVQRYRAHQRSKWLPARTPAILVEADRVLGTRHHAPAHRLVSAYLKRGGLLVGSVRKCGSLRQCAQRWGSVWQSVAVRSAYVYTQSRSHYIYWYAFIQGAVGLSLIFLACQY
jgi:hypothetical protein